MKKKILLSLIFLLFLTGLLTFLYPFISNWNFSKASAAKVEMHEIKYNDMTNEETQDEIKRAKAYNEAIRIQHAKVSVANEDEPQILSEYNEILNIDEIMCVIEIPKIKVILSVFHGVSDKTLEKGVGHMRETSLPVGGRGTHSYLTGHTGHPRAKLFSDLDELQIGDRFLIDVLGERLAYCIDKISTVAAEEFSEVEITENGDYVTLVTCIPEGINSHRLLVRGERVNDMPDFPNETKEINEKTLSKDFMIMCVIILIAIILIALLIVLTRKCYLYYMQK